MGKVFSIKCDLTELELIYKEQTKVLISVHARLLETYSKSLMGYFLSHKSILKYIEVSNCNMMKCVSRFTVYNITFYLHITYAAIIHSFLCYAFIPHPFTERGFFSSLILSFDVNA